MFVLTIEHLVQQWSTIRHNIYMSSSDVHILNTSRKLFFNFSSQTNRLPVSERRLIIINADQDVRSNRVSQFLKHHRQVVFFDELEIQRTDNMLFIVTDTNRILDICLKLFKCLPHHLSFFVDYANKNLLSPNQRLLCGNNKRYQQTEGLNNNSALQIGSSTYGDCQPVPKTLVADYCLNHHLAFRMALSPVKTKHEEVVKSHVRIVSLSGATAQELFSRDYYHTHDLNVPSLDRQLEGYNEMRFHLSDFDPPGDKGSFLELLNFLDLY